MTQKALDENKKYTFGTTPQRKLKEHNATTLAKFYRAFLFKGAQTPEELRNLCRSHKPGWGTDPKGFAAYAHNSRWIAEA